MRHRIWNRGTKYHCAQISTPISSLCLSDPVQGSRFIYCTLSWELEFNSIQICKLIPSSNGKNMQVEKIISLKEKWHLVICPPHTVMHRGSRKLFVMIQVSWMEYFAERKLCEIELCLACLQMSLFFSGLQN